jgi:hypothetical protein
MLEDKPGRTQIVMTNETMSTVRDLVSLDIHRNCFSDWAYIRPEHVVTLQHTPEVTLGLTPTARNHYQSSMQIQFRV